MERIAPVRRDIDGEAFLDQPTAREAGHLAVVFYQENPHQTS